MDEETREFIAGRQAFLAFLSRWVRGLPSLELADVIAEAGGPENVAVICIDITNCFTKSGPLSSSRIRALIPPVAELFRHAYAQGVRTFMLSQDAHPADSPEFEAYGPHCVEGTEGTHTVQELMDLPFSDLFQVIPKRALNPGTDERFNKWLDEHMNAKRFIVVGDCTDLCVYQIAMWLKIRANQFYYDYDVIVPANCVDTYDTSLDKARELAILPHDAELLHQLFLYHMALNDIRMACEIVG
jgi:nicotinamidase-related amidase